MKRDCVPIAMLLALKEGLKIKMGSWREAGQEKRTEVVCREERVEEEGGVQWCGRLEGWGSRKLHPGEWGGRGEVGSECQADSGLRPKD